MRIRGWRVYLYYLFRFWELPLYKNSITTSNGVSSLPPDYHLHLVAEPATEITQILLRCSPHLEDLLDGVNRVKLANLERSNHENPDSFEDGVVEHVSRGGDSPIGRSAFHWLRGRVSGIEQVETPH